MKSIFLNRLSCIICFISIIVGNSTQTFSQTQIVNINKLIPSPEEIPGWFQDGDSEYARGEDLYTIINGGAEIYHEYGFQQAVFLTYMNKNENQINLAIFEMNDSPSAYGIYSFKTDTGGVAMEIGEEGWLSSYYLNFWKGNFLVTIVGLDDAKETMDGIIQIAKAVDQKIQMTSKKPDLIKYLPVENLVLNGVTYIKGLLGLFNTYNFHSKNIFNFNEGLHAIYDSYEIFLFNYSNANDARKWFSSATKNLEKSEKYSDFTNIKDCTIFSDDSGNDFTMKAYRKFIIILLTREEIDNEQLFRKIKQHIDSMRVSK